MELPETEMSSLLALFSGTEGMGYLMALFVLLSGLFHFLLPRTAMRHLKLEGVLEHPEAVGEARSSFAGFPVAAGALVLATQAHPVQFALALSLAIAALGKLIHILFDGSRLKSVVLRFVLVAAMAVLILPSAMLASGTVAMPSDPGAVLSMITGVITVLFGLICFFAPLRALLLMRLRPVDAFPAAKGEVRGMLAGFYLGVGLTVLLVGGFYPALLIGLAWLATAFGRMISMLSDDTNNTFNWVSLLLELALALLPLTVVLGLYG